MIERRAPDEMPFAIEHHDLDRNPRVRDDARGGYARSDGHLVTKPDILRGRERERFGGSIGRENLCVQLTRPPAGLRNICERHKIDRAALRVQVKQALRELADLGDATGDGDVRDRMRAHVLEHSADEVAHVDNAISERP